MYQILIVLTFGGYANEDGGGRAATMKTLEFKTRAHADVAFDKLYKFKPPFGTFSALKLYQD
jgi:hypothetical protein